MKNESVEQNKFTKEIDGIILPKNIRQIGEVLEEEKIYLEDYVATYLNQIAIGDMEQEKVVFLLGKIIEDQGKKYYFIRGAICKEDSTESDELVKEKYFPNMHIIGRALIKNENSDSRINFKYLTETSKNYMIFMEMDKYSGVERFYICDQLGGKVLPGYYIYYDRNEEMQIYLIAWNEQQRKTSVEGDPDRATRQFRATMEERKVEKKQVKMMYGLYTVSMSLLIMVCVLGITMMNNYEKMKGMEEALSYIALALHEQEEDINIKTWTIGSSNDEQGNISDNTVKEESNLLEEASSLEEENANATATAVEEATAVGEVNALEPANANANVNVEEQTNANTPAVDNAEEQAELAETTSPTVTMTEYIVKDGDTLASICRSYYNSTKKIDEICQINDIDDKDNIYSGQKILLP